MGKRESGKKRGNERGREKGREEGRGGEEVRVGGWKV